MKNSCDAWQLENDQTQVLRPVIQEQMRLIVKQRFGKLSRNDRTLAGLRPVAYNRTRPVANGTLLEVTGRWGPAFSPTL